MELKEPVKPAVEPVIVTAPTAPSKSGTARTKSTLNLQNIFADKTPADKSAKENGTQYKKRNLTREEVSKAWLEYAETRRSQVAEYSLLMREFELDGHTIKLQLTNPVEETLLYSVRTELLTSLKEKLQCEVALEGVLLEVEAKKMIYTNKEKFDHLVEKHPALLELKDRLGLDTDF